MCVLHFYFKVPEKNRDLNAYKLVNPPIALTHELVIS